MRDRLIELIGQAKAMESSGIDCKVSDEYIADHLLANGVVVPPCKVGQTIYIVGLGEVEAGVVVSMNFECNVSEIESECLAVGKHTIEFAFRNIGKTVFLTREEAEAKLKEE